MGIFRTYKNRKIEEYYKSLTTGCIKDGIYISNIQVISKNGNFVLVSHRQIKNDDGKFCNVGKYSIFYVKKQIGYLKYVFHPKCNDTACYIVLCDICLEKKYRNYGIGSKVLAIFEEFARKQGCKFIEGDLSDIDEQHTKDEEIRNNFYINNHYKFVGDKVVKYL